MNCSFYEVEFIPSAAPQLRRLFVPLPLRARRRVIPSSLFPATVNNDSALNELVEITLKFIGRTEKCSPVVAVSEPLVARLPSENVCSAGDN